MLLELSPWLNIRHFFICILYLQSHGRFSIAPGSRIRRGQTELHTLAQLSRVFSPVPLIREVDLLFSGRIVREAIPAMVEQPGRFSLASRSLKGSTLLVSPITFEFLACCLSLEFSSLLLVFGQYIKPEVAFFSLTVSNFLHVRCPQ